MTMTTNDHDTHRVAQTLATGLVHGVLHDAAEFGDTVTHKGNHYAVVGPVRADARPGQLDGLVTFNLGADGTPGVSVVLHVAATPLPGGIK